MTLSKLALATAGILIMGISLTACTATNSKPSEPSRVHIYADCTSLKELTDEKEKVTVAAIDAPRSTRSNPEPPQESAGCPSVEKFDR